MRFNVTYRIGASIKKDVIEADSLEEATLKADQIHPSWLDVVYQNYSYAQEAY